MLGRKVRILALRRKVLLVSLMLNRGAKRWEVEGEKLEEGRRKNGEGTIEHGGAIC